MTNKKGIKIEDIVFLYNSGLSPAQIAEEKNCCVVNITRRLKKYGINFKRDYSKTRYRRTNKHKINLYFFDNIITEEQAYFLGLMFADGSVSTNQFYLKMTDEDIIQKFKNALQTDVNIMTRFYKDKNYKPSYTLQISSQYMCEALSKLGCTPNKTHTLQFPDINPNLYNHFIRGFFDGDGCLSISNRAYQNRVDFVCASKKFLDALRVIISQHSKTNGNVYKEKKHDIWHLRYGGHQTKQIMDWLYENSTVYLNRKHFKYLLLGSR